MSTPAALRLLRGTDLLDLTFGFAGLKVEETGGNRRLVRADPQADGWIAVTFGPQHTVEQAFSDEVPGESRALPVGSLISGRSVLVFDVGPQDAVPFSEDGLLDAMRRLPLRVVDAARAPETPAAPALGPPPADAGGEDAAARAMTLVRLLRTTAELTARHGPEAALALARAAGVPTASAGTAAPLAAAGPQDPLADPHAPAPASNCPTGCICPPPRKRAGSTGTGPPHPAPAPASSSGTPGSTPLRSARSGTGSAAATPAPRTPSGRRWSGGSPGHRGPHHRRRPPPARRHAVRPGTGRRTAADALDGRRLAGRSRQLAAAAPRRLALRVAPPCLHGPRPVYG
ncbi:putative protein OS=Streptomyces rimosus subsp. rimosus (strain ATCC / DSM 40260 / JCM 4667 / NRRL 2234) OX=1265868 GN=SRIM_003045 PE=4 SV=1 [Streptomyces rimosus subsp. rimosus]